MELPSHPTAVTVYRSGAVVERRIPLDQPAPGPLVLPGLPLALIDDATALSVEFAGTGHVAVSGLTVRLHARPRDEAPETPDHAALRAVKGDLLRTQRQLQHLEHELNLLSGIPMPRRPEPPEGQAPPPSPLAARVALDAFVDAQSAERHDALRDLHERLRELRREEQALDDAIAHHAASRQARPDELTKAVHATLALDGAPTDVVLVLHYRVPGARWVPQYAVDVSDTEATLRLRAALVQASGEDWKGVDLTLSTAEPQSYTPLPQLKAMRIGKLQPPLPTPSLRPAPSGTDALYSDFDRARAQLLPSRGPQRAPAPPPRPPMPAPPSDVFEEAMDDAEDAYLGSNFDMARESEAPPEAPRMEMAAAMPEPAPSAAPRRAKAKKSMPQPAMMAAPAPGGMRSAPQAPQAPQAPRFATLRLPSPTDPQRTALRQVDEASEHRDAIARLGLELAGDPAAMIRGARARSEAAAQLPLPPQTAAVRPDHFDHAVRASAPVDVPGDGSWHTLPIQHGTGACRIRYVGVPRAEPQLYRVATLANALGTPLLPGPVDVNVDGAYVLTAQLPATGAGESLDLGMGVEPALRVARNTRFEEQRSGDRVVAMSELHHHIHIQLRNTLRRDAEVEVRERVPIPDGDAEVAVDVLASEPPWAPYDQVDRGAPIDGGHLWRVVVPAGQELELSAHYVVRLYANHEVVGGNRREA